MTINPLTSIDILGVKVHPLTVSALHSYISSCINSESKSVILNVNAYCLNLAYQESWLRDYLNSADIVFCDGSGVIVGARLLGYQIPQRITYADWMWQLAKFAEQKQYSLFFLGAEPGVSQQAADQLQKRFPRLCIAGALDGYFNKSKSSRENQTIINRINQVRPNILVVGFGMPLQERWLMENWECIHANIALTGGAVFDYVSGSLKRAPRWMTDHNLEWLGRLAIEPRRLWKRYVLGNPLFLYRVTRQRLGIFNKK